MRYLMLLQDLLFYLFCVCQKLAAMRNRRLAMDAARKPGDLLRNLIALQLAQGCISLATLLYFFDEKIAISHGGQLRQVRYADNLPCRRDFCDFLRHHLRHAPADSRIETIRLTSSHPLAL